MIELFARDIDVHYGFVHLREEDGELPEPGREGQENGLLGARSPHALTMTTGLHTGGVPFRVEWHEMEPPLDDAWQDVVEASVELVVRELVLATFDDGSSVRAPRLGWHRARYSGTEMDAGREMDCPTPGESAPDSYLLQLWPAPPAPDRVVKVTSEIAAYWHDVARGVVP
ncbi:hypothetical protein IF650_09845 [Cellulosimicrobium terreum]|nr:hypothetical protein [Cellulosimicrobium terreum]